MGTEEAWRQRVVQMIDWFEPIRGKVIAAFEGRMSDKPLIPGSHPIARFDAPRYYICLTENTLILLQAPNMRVGRWLWILKRPLERVPRPDVKIDEVVEDPLGRMSMRVSLPGRRPTYLMVESGWREEGRALKHALAAESHG